MASPGLQSEWRKPRGKANFSLAAIAMVLTLTGEISHTQPSTSQESRNREDAVRMIRSAEGVLAPVYAPLAEQIVRDFELAKVQGIGIDLGSGPGTLILELAKRTQLHWINADINPSFFSYFFKQAEKSGVGDRVSAILADAHRLPFCDNYAEVIVSRGCFFFWENKPQAFAEIYRVLKPGGIAYIGRGMARDFPAEEARLIRAQQKGNRELDYDPQTSAGELDQALRQAGIEQFEIELPKPEGATDLHYGIWVTFRKPSP